MTAIYLIGLGLFSALIGAVSGVFVLIVVLLIGALVRNIVLWHYKQKDSLIVAYVTLGALIGLIVFSHLFLNVNIDLSYGPLTDGL